MHRWSLRLLFAAAAVALVGATAATATPASAPLATIPVVGTTSGGETFSGTLAITGVAVQDGQAYVLGTLAGTPVAVPVQAQGDPCTLVSFSLGPIDLNVAGLIGVHIDPIGLDVTLSGLLGDLLCPLLGGSGGSTPPPVPA